MEITHKKLNGHEPGKPKDPPAPVPHHPHNKIVARLVEIRQSMQFANESPGGGITGTIWMMDSLETVFDAMDELIESVKAETPPARSPSWQVARDNLAAVVSQAEDIRLRTNDSHLYAAAGAVQSFAEEADMALESCMDLTAIMSRQESWLKSMGWFDNKTPLEALMLVVSECGEAANEVRGDKPTDNFRIELADIILRVLGIAAEQGIDIQQAVIDKQNINFERKPRADRVK